MGWYKRINFPEDIYNTVSFIGADGEVFSCYYVPEEQRITSRIIIRNLEGEQLS